MFLMYPGYVNLFEWDGVWNLYGGNLVEHLVAVFTPHSLQILLEFKHFKHTVLSIHN